ncbi:hypothetical protein [Vibrio phage MZH0603]|nr:hypothetical protein [Vibrio phage MZH0603]
MEIIVYDLDGTLRDTSCGDPYIPEDKTKPDNWVEWQRYVNRKGEYLPTYRHYARDLAARKEVYILTNSQFGTAHWLKHSGLSQPDKIIERKLDDRRHPVKYKVDWIDKHHADVVKWVDDCKDVCDYIREHYPHIEVVKVGAPEQIESTPKKDTPNKVVIFNGPPRSGKDLATSFCCEYFNGKHATLKESLIKLTADFLGITVEDFLNHYDAKCDDKTYEESACVWVKDLPMYKVGETYLSKREALIHVSENVMKPSFGDDVFGKMVADNLPEGLVFFSDGGFPEEVQPLADKVGIENILIVHIKRDNYTFEGDSRDYVNIEGVKTVVVENDTLGKYLADVARQVVYFINV